MPELCRIAAVVPRVKPGDVVFNTDEIIACTEKAAANAVLMICCSMCITPLPIIRKLPRWPKPWLPTGAWP